MNNLSPQPSPLESRPAGEATKAIKNSLANSKPGTATDKTNSPPAMDAFEQSRIAFFSK